MSSKSTRFGISALLILGMVGFLGAAGEQRQPARYDASIIATTGDLVVVDHQTNKLFIYGQHHADWVLRSTTDLNQVGAVKIEPQHPPQDTLREALGRDAD